MVHDEIADIAILEPCDGVHGREDSGRVKAGLDRIEIVTLSQVIAELRLRLTRRQTLSREELRELGFAELAGDAIEGERELLDLVVNQLRSRIDADAGEQFGQRLIVGDGAEKLLVKGNLNQKAVRQRLFR